MYYSSGNYEAFAHPLKPEGVDAKQAYIIGSGLAGLTAACYLIRDGQMEGKRIHILCLLYTSQGRQRSHGNHGAGDRARSQEGC